MTNEQKAMVAQAAIPDLCGLLYDVQAILQVVKYEWADAWSDFDEATAGGVQKAILLMTLSSGTLPRGYVLSDAEKELLKSIDIARQQLGLPTGA